MSDEDYSDEEDVNSHLLVNEKDPISFDSVYDVVVELQDFLKDRDIPILDSPHCATGLYQLMVYKLGR
jgi:hypothetical protein